MLEKIKLRKVFLYREVKGTILLLKFRVLDLSQYDISVLSKLISSMYLESTQAISALPYLKFGNVAGL